ncbi:hypothetical protein ABC610_03450 [Mycoplasmopsis synoviae]|uniref:hypothetical protein n=1 Tax=Mycoplasmopsis synoviae TaxID=2109 RepID=UPI0012A96DFB|nr:hypothetical protein EJ916_01005 [Mycoplasmopsis synoviae]QXV99683.1 hypothetical protein KXD88_01250 [Mycoplasmopsis synoviae]UBX97931.1 hypothetical protein K6987_02700 [Mycoplasmopsis synoviae]ULL02646.1 hypothetical protein JM201_01345 [Mycoplasmopsis synoviae]
MQAIIKYIQTFDPKFKTSVDPNASQSTYRAWVSWMETRERDMQRNPALVQVELKILLMYSWNKFKRK